MIRFISLVTVLFIASVSVVSAESLYGPEEARSADLVTEAEKKAYLREAYGAYDNCQIEHNFARAYNCRCIAAHIYKVRIETDNFFSHSDIVRNALPSCKDAPKFANHHFQQCLSWASTMHGESEKFCECYGNNIAKNFAKGHLVSAQAEEGIMSLAISECGQKYPSQLFGQRAARKTVRQELKEQGLFKNLFPSFNDGE